MSFLEKRIREDGRVLPGNILKVDSFLNHQIDMALLDEMAKVFHQHFSKYPITKILTIEASGIAIACSVARLFGVPLLFAKKSNSDNIGEDLWSAKAYSYTRKKENTIVVSKRYLQEGDCVLIVDDFLAHGEACQALVSLTQQAGASLAGIGIAIEKGFQQGGESLRQQGIDLLSLAIIEQMNEESILFR